MARLNVQGLARRDELLMGALLADPGFTFVSVDLSAGEPSATCHYSGDKNYADAIFNMVGKRPFFDSRGVLKIDDIYLTAASFSPLGKNAVYEAFNTTYEGVSGFDVWLESPDRIKKALGDVRPLHKVLVLGIGYAMGPRKMVKSCYEKGFNISFQQAKQFTKAYWAWCPDVKRLSKYLEDKLLADGYLVNDFGYRLVPDVSYKAFNYFIQSTISGVVNVLDAKFAFLCPEARFVTIIHDELIYQIPTDRLAYAKQKMQEAVDSLNNDLNWTVKIRTGWAEGSSLYEAK